MQERRAVLVHYAIAAAAAAVAVLIRWILSPLLDYHLPFVTFFGAVAVAVWVGGWKPAVLAALLGYLGSLLVVIGPEPQSRLLPITPAGITTLGAYAFTCLIIISLGSGMREARRRAEASAQEARAKQIELEREMAEREATESVLRAKEAELALITQRTPLLLTRCSRDLRYAFANRAYAQFVGRTPEQVIGRRIVDVIGPEALAEIQPRIDRVLRGEVVEYETEIPFAHPGSRFMHAVYTPDRDEAGEVIGWIASITDVSERKRNEQALRRSEERLASELAARTRSDAALREADRQKDEFLAVLAHELRNPLAPISTAVQLLRLEKDPSPEAQAANEIIDRQTRQLARLIDDLMDISRITRNRLELRRENVELAQIVADAVEASRPLIDEKGHRLVLELPSQPVVLDGDVTRLAQVFSNLLNNAARYSEPGAEIRLAAGLRDGGVSISVRDTGMGISSAQLPHIFEGERLSGERSHDGLGIGLMLVRRLVEMHGGSVEARSGGPGEGSEFVVQLPIAASREHGLPQPRVAEPLAAAPVRRRILIADDNRDAAVTLARMLERLGYETLSAYDGLQALELAGTFRPDVMLLDVGMPKASGLEVARRVRLQPWGERTVLVAITGWGQTEDKQRTDAAGFDHHLVKPVLLRDLAALLASLGSARPEDDPSGRGAIN
jgi:PAS domain S-box-containing protein